jgi:hypothetical protein
MRSLVYGNGIVSSSGIDKREKKDGFQRHGPRKEAERRDTSISPLVKKPAQAHVELRRHWAEHTTLPTSTLPRWAITPGEISLDVLRKFLGDEILEINRKSHAISKTREPSPTELLPLILIKFLMLSMVWTIFFGNLYSTLNYGPSSAPNSPIIYHIYVI